MIETHNLDYVVVHQRSQVEGSIKTTKNTMNLSLSKKNLKNEQLSVLVGRSISSAIEDAEEASQLHSGNWDSIPKADEWRKESHPNGVNTILVALCGILRS